MSNAINTDLLERAAELIDYFDGKLPAQLLQADLDNDDLESLQRHVVAAHSLQFEIEYSPDETSDVE